jgi:bifunctional non-homologous end joining protein LigD
MAALREARGDSLPQKRQSPKAGPAFRLQS